MARKNQPFTLDALIKKGDGTLIPDNENKSLEQGQDGAQVTLFEGDASAETGYPIRRQTVPFKKMLEDILAMEISPKTVSEAVKSTPLGDKITYQEAVLIAQVLKAANGDTQAAVYLRDTTGNKLKSLADSTEAVLSFEDLD